MQVGKSAMLFWCITDACFNVTTEDIKNAVLSENAVTNIYQNDYAKYNMIVIMASYVV